MREICVIDNFVDEPQAYRRAALALDYRSYEFPDVGVTFHGIAMPTGPEVPGKLVRLFPGATPTLSFFRRSPEGQKEPHYIHTDADMGEWTALLYLNPDPPEEDGTMFWRYLPTGEIANATPHVRSAEGMTPSPALWEAWRIVYARFNRLVLFPSTYLHSRAMFDNWSTDEDTRLTQVTFGTGAI